jgi:predicted transcriptional regulator
MPDREHIAKIVSAYAKRNQLPADQPIEGGGLPEPAKELVPAVPIRRSVRPDEITCLDCGHSGRLLKRHLMTAHQLSPGEYRRRWGLKDDYPMSAPNYAARRSELAKSIGLGQRNRGRGQRTSHIPALTADVDRVK